MESLEPGQIFRNQQVAGSTPAGGSIFSIISTSIHKPRGRVGSNRGSNGLFRSVRETGQQGVHCVGRGALSFAVNVAVNVLGESAITFAGTPCAPSREMQA